MNKLGRFLYTNGKVVQEKGISLPPIEVEAGGSAVERSLMSLYAENGAGGLGDLVSPSTLLMVDDLLGEKSGKEDDVGAAAGEDESVLLISDIMGGGGKMEEPERERDEDEGGSDSDYDPVLQTARNESKRRDSRKTSTDTLLSTSGPQYDSDSDRSPQKVKEESGTKSSAPSSSKIDLSELAECSKSENWSDSLK